MADATRTEVLGWAMYDFANSSYTTVIITVYYAVAFPKIVVGDGPEFRTGNFLWGVTLAASYLLSVILLPFLGAWMDGVGHRNDRGLFDRERGMYSLQAARRRAEITQEVCARH